MLRYIRAHPFSIMALCNILGDLCYLGFAFDAVGFVSWTKLGGASFTMFAHILLLAYGDDQAHAVKLESGLATRLFFRLRDWAQSVTTTLPMRFQKLMRSKPVGISFLMLSLNGLAFLIDGFNRLKLDFTIAMLDQVFMGAIVLLGTAFFAWADFTKQQATANSFTKLAPTLLGFASICNFVLAVTTHNVFIILSCVIFSISNFAGFYTRIHKPSREDS